MASYNKNIDSGYTTQVQTILQGLGANLGAGGVDGKWGAYTDAAYNKYKSQVDAALAGGSNIYGNGMGSMSGNSFFTPFQTPSLSYTTRTLDDLLAEATGFIGGLYDAQMLRQTQGYNASQQALARSYETARKTTQDSAVARGLGRSSYLTDSIANVGVREADATGELARNYNDMMAQLEANKSNAVYSYVSQQQAQDQQRALEAALAQAELQYKYDALNAEMELAAAQLAATGSGSSALSGTTTSPTKTKTKTEDYVDALSSVAVQPTKSNNFMYDHLLRSADNLASKGKTNAANDYTNLYNSLTGNNAPSYVDITDKNNIRDFLKKKK